MANQKIAVAAVALAALFGSACASDDPSPVKGGQATAEETPRALPRQVDVTGETPYSVDMGKMYEVSKAARAGEAVVVSQPEQRDPMADMVRCGIQAELDRDPDFADFCAGIR